MNRIDKGKRNFDFASKLHDEKLYPDWCIIASFYSAIHFIEYALFDDTKRTTDHPYLNLDSAKKHIGCSSLHKARTYLVKNYLKPIQNEYLFLYNTCYELRYNQFNAYLDDDRKAIQYLKKIISHIHPDSL